MTKGGKTYTDTFTYDTVGDTRNSPNELRSEILGKTIRFTYLRDIYFRTTLFKAYEYDINSNQLLDTYQYSGYYELEPITYPNIKDVTLTDANNNLVKSYSFFKNDVNGPILYITFGTDTVHLSYDSNNNITAYDTGNASTKITYTYDTKPNPLSILGAENEYLGYVYFGMPQTFVKNQLTVTTGGSTKTYVYQYDQYGNPVNATVNDGTTYKYEYVAHW